MGLGSSAQRRGAVCLTGSPRRRPATVPTITVRAGLVRYLRRGIRHEVADTLRELRVAIEVAHHPVDAAAYGKALSRLDSARALLDAIGLNDGGDVRDVEVDTERWRGLVLKAVSAQYEVEVSRLEDAAAGGFPGLVDSNHDVHALAELVAELRRTIVIPSPPRPGAGWPRRHRGAA